MHRAIVSAKVLGFTIGYTDIRIYRYKYFTSGFANALLVFRRRAANNKHALVNSIFVDAMAGDNNDEVLRKLEELDRKLNEIKKDNES